MALEPPPSEVHIAPHYALHPLLAHSQAWLDHFHGSYAQELEAAAIKAVRAAAAAGGSVAGRAASGGAAGGAGSAAGGSGRAGSH